MNKISILAIIIILTPLVLAENNTSTVEENATTNISIIQEERCEAFSIEGIELFVKNGEKISYTFNGWKTGDSISYWIEDLYGTIWKKEYTSMNNNKKTYTTNIDEQEKVLFLKAKRNRTDCELAVAEKMFIVYKETNNKENNETTKINETEQVDENETKKEAEEEIEEDIKILAYDDEIQSGKTIHIELFVQKNTNRNNAFYLWLENEEEKKIGETKINLHQKGSYNIEINIPINLDTCGNAFERQILHFTGLGKEEQEKIYVLQEACEEENTEEKNCSEITISNDILLEENPIQSLYVRAQKWQENISLYSNLKKETQVWIFGPLAENKTLAQGTITTTIKPKIGNNTFAMLTETGEGKIVHFYLEGKEQKEHTHNSTIVAQGYHFSAPSEQEHENESIEENKITSQVIYTTKNKRNIPVLASIILMSSIILLLTEYKARKRALSQKE